MINKKNISSEIQKITSQIKNCHPKKVILFGSAVRGDFNENSDLDFFIVKDTNLPFIKRSRVFYEKCFTSNSPELPVDLIIYTPEEVLKAEREHRIFIEQVLSHGKIMYESA